MSRIGKGVSASRTPEQLTAKEEKFALLYVECGNAHEAYLGSRDASRMDPRTSGAHASKLLKVPRVAKRIRQLQAAMLERHNITVDDLTNKLLKIHDDALEEKSFIAAVRAVEGIAKLHGLFIEKKAIIARHEHDFTGGDIGLQRLARFFERALPNRANGSDAGVVEGGPVLSVEVRPEP